MDESQSSGEITRNAPKGSPVRGGALRSGAFRSGAFRSGAFRGAREWAGWLLVAAGAVLCVLGWYGVSGERFVEQQIPYLASSTIPGAALIVAGTLLVALRPPSPPERQELTDRRVERLYELLVEPPDDEPPDHGPPDDGPSGAPAPDAPPSGTRPTEGWPTEGWPTEGWLAVPEGTRYHRPDCPLVTGKTRAAPVDAATVLARGLTPCPLCSPPATGPGPGPGPGPATRPGESAPPAG
ncbi:hypothetical protein ACFZDG_16915 [Kitasatospora xanthocidica]|uniref:hypothetical protein n=1 Tax=Kitasatospora xanthocidica TaxID=83382 RepID=UPI0036E55A14